MNETLWVIIGLVMIVVLLVLRMPIGVSLLFAGTVGFSMIRGPITTLETLGSRLFDIGSGYEVSAVPLFLLMGYFASTAGITQDIYNAARAWFGHLKGSLVLATTFAAAGFGACCGSTTSSTAVFGKVAIPEMLRFKVDRRLAAGCIATVGTLAGMIPPSINLIVFGILSRQSIPKLLIAGFIPGMMTALAYAVMIYVRVNRNPELAPSLPRVSRAEKVRSIGGIWGVIVLGALVMGGIFTGIFTPTEAGAIGAAGAFVIALGRKTLSLRSIRDVLIGTAQTTSVLFITLVGAMIFSSYLAMCGSTTAIANFLIGLDVPPLATVSGYMLLLILLGCVIDPISMMFLTVPIIVPPLLKIGIDPIWIGILVAKTLEIGAITPPFGINAFMLKSVAPEFSLPEIYRGIWWFLQVELITLLLLILFPAISTWLPSIVFK
jgi:tripartite ATP-independent transporter DctM subunit